MCNYCRELTCRSWVAARLAVASRVLLICGTGASSLRGHVSRRGARGQRTRSERQTCASSVHGTFLVIKHSVHTLHHMPYFKAPWSTALILISSLATALCLGISFWRWDEVVSMRVDTLRYWTALLPVALAVGAALFVVRGYAITPDAVLVRRLLWTTRVPRSGFQSARFEPEALRRSIRICGNGGFLSFTGWFRSRTLEAIVRLPPIHHGLWCCAFPTGPSS